VLIDSNVNARPDCCQQQWKTCFTVYKHVEMIVSLTREKPRDDTENQSR